MAVPNCNGAFDLNFFFEIKKVINFEGYISDHVKNSITNPQAMLSVMAAYVCDAENWGAKIVPNKKWKGIKALGRQKEKECTRRHIKRSLDMFKSLKIKGDARIQVETEVRAVVFNTIVDYNDAKTRTNVVEAIREVQKVAAQSQEDAARVTSSPSLTNEL